MLLKSALSALNSHHQQQPYQKQNWRVDEAVLRSSDERFQQMLIRGLLALSLHERGARQVRGEGESGKR